MTTRNRIKAALGAACCAAALCGVLGAPAGAATSLHGGKYQWWEPSPALNPETMKTAGAPGLLFRIQALS